MVALLLPGAGVKFLFFGGFFFIFYFFQVGVENGFVLLYFNKGLEREREAIGDYEYSLLLLLFMEILSFIVIFLNSCCKNCSFFPLISVWFYGR